MTTVPQVKRFPGRTVWRAIASGLGVGYVPIAPGTFGSLLAFPFWFLGGGWGVFHVGALAALMALSLPAAIAEREATGRSDPSSVVIDETAGMLLAATGIPLGWKSGIVLFLLFRLFDIVKFGPPAWFNSRDGALYVLADDLAAALYANLAYRGILWLTG